jgi:Lipase (class 3)
MSLTDLEVATLVNGMYAYPGDAPIAWDHLDTGADNDGVYWGLKRQGDLSVVVFRGSTTAEDFARDAETAFWPDRDLGPVHLGFLQGMKDVWHEVRTNLTAGSWIAAGHSLGAARALILAGIAKVNGCAPASAVVFGEPRPGFQRLSDILAPVPIRSYRNTGADGHDLVTDVPFYVPGVFPYDHPRPLIDVSESPTDPNDWSPFRYHHMPLYLAAVSKFAVMPTTP